MVGVGITLEGIHTNWVTNEALLSQGWEFFVPHANAKENASLNKWVQDFVSRRYNSGGNATMLQSAWSRLANFSTTSVYNGPRGNYFEGWGNTRSLVTRRPFWPLGEASGWGWNNDGTSDGFMGDAPRYDPRALLQALRELLSGAAAGESSSSLPTSLAVDVVDLCVTTMANAWLVQLGGMINMTSGNMTSKKVAQIQALGAEMIAGIAVTDEVLASNENFLLGKWISDAKSWANKPWAFRSSSEKKEEESGEDEAALLEFNARNQVTMWGPPLFVGANPSRYGSPGSPQDYAAKTWAGLYGSFYLQRQQLFFNMLNDAATEAVAVDAAPIDFVKLAPKFTNASVAFEVRWGASTSSEVFASTPTGNTFALAAKAVETYGAIVDNATWCQIEYVGKLWYNVDKGGVMNFWVMSEFVDHLLHSNPNYYFSLVRCEGPAAGRI